MSLAFNDESQLVAILITLESGLKSEEVITSFGKGIVKGANEEKQFSFEVWEGE